MCVLEVFNPPARRRRRHNIFIPHPLMRDVWCLTRVAVCRLDLLRNCTRFVFWGDIFLSWPIYSNPAQFQLKTLLLLIFFSPFIYFAFIYTLYLNRYTNTRKSPSFIVPYIQKTPPRPLFSIHTRMKLQVWLYIVSKNSFAERVIILLSDICSFVSIIIKF